MPDINIGSKFDAKGFKQAETATDKLGKQAKKLAGTFGLAFGTARVLAYGKAAVKAAAADQKAQQGLALALKNVGLQRDAGAAEGFIQKLQSEFGIVDDKLRPAYQALAVATRDTAESQRLLNLALDISAATGKDLGSVTAALSRAYLGNNTALSRLGVGISKADLKTKSFYEITTDLAETFRGSATAAANTFQGAMDKLAVASANVQEIIGTGIIDALGTLGGNTAVDDLADDMERAALSAADFLRGLAQIGTFKVSGETKSILGLLLTPFQRSLSAGPLGAITRLGEASRIAPKPFTTPMTISGQVQVKQQTKITKLTKDQAAAQAKITKDKKVQNAIDKANLALTKGNEVFDLDRIQVAAALTNQAEQLGKATNASQLLQITNDTARLNVKQSILALEDAIASKDEAAIIAATNKLNADNKILGSLILQDLKMKDIKTILESLNPKDLINLGNLDAAIAKMIELNKLQGSKTGTAPTPAAAAAAAAAAAGATDGAPVYTIPKNTKDFTKENPTIFKLVNETVAFASKSVQDSFYDAMNEGATLPGAVLGANYQARAEQEYAAFLSQINMSGIAGQSLTSGMNQGLPLSNALSGSRYAAQGAASYGAGATIVVNTGVGDPEAIARAVEDVIRQANQRGTTSLSIG
jgi:hypothetical protein